MMKRLGKFDYYEPRSFPEAVEILSAKGADALPFAGGTDVLVRMKRGEISPSFLVNLKRVECLRRIREEGDGTGMVQCGSMVTISELIDDSFVRMNFPLLVQSANAMGCWSIRNLATVGGNIGRGSPASDLAPALIALGARVNIGGVKGNRTLEVEDVFVSPGRTSLSSGEIIRSFSVKRMGQCSGSCYLKLGRTRGMDCAIVGVAVFVQLDRENKRFLEARIAMASVGPVPLRARKAETVLLEGSMNLEMLRASALEASEEAVPQDDMRASSAYRRGMVEVLSFRALERAVAMAKGNGGRTSAISHRVQSQR